MPRFIQYKSEKIFASSITDAITLIVPQYIIFYKKQF